MKVREVGEGALIRSIRERFLDAQLIVGIGDDAAVLEIPAGFSVVACSDLVVEGTHFLREVHPPESIGYKAVAVNASDVAAMAGIPMHFLISLAVPEDLDWSWIEQFLDGVSQACGKFHVSLIGGDSSSADRVFVDVSMLGRVPAGKSVRRSGAKPGDGIYVTGRLGGSALGLELLKRGDRDHVSVQRHLYPEPRLAVGSAVTGLAHAMIDISDGLSTDLGHILDESRVSARIYRNRIPAFPDAGDLHVLHGGEEYELLIVAPDLPSQIDGVPLTRIGEILDSALNHQIFLVDGSNEAVLEPRGWQHF